MARFLVKKMPGFREQIRNSFYAVGRVLLGRPQEYSVPTNELTQCFDPFDRSIWKRGEVTREGIEEAVKLNLVETLPWDVFYDELYDPAQHGDGADFDRRRIAYFVVHGLPSNRKHPITLLFENDKLTIQHGRHRIAAAVVRGDPAINFTFIGNSAELPKLFPNAVRIPQNTGLVAEEKSVPSVPALQQLKHWLRRLGR